jgi:hypothetical protein
MERNVRSNLIKLLFADDESVVSSTISEDPAYQNQIQSQDDPHGSQSIDIKMTSYKTKKVKLLLKLNKKRKTSY